jgi:hypothetical protein
MQDVILDLIGTRVHLSGPPTLVELYELTFGWFVVPADESPAELSFRVRSADDGYAVSVEMDGQVEDYRFESEELVYGFIYALILDQVTRRDSDLLCVHAAALARGGHGLALAAPSQHGKSTLSLALSARDFTFLSDEVAPIRRSSLTLLPFPMAIGCRPGTYELLRGTEFAQHEFAPHEYTDKMLYDPRARSGPSPEPVPIRAVFFIEPAEAKGFEHRRHRLWLDTPAEHLVDEIEGLAGVRSAQAENRGSSVVVEVEPGAWVAPALEGLLRERGVMVTTVEDLDAPRPDFDSEPVLTRLPASEGVLALFRHLRGFGAIKDLSEATPGGFGALLIDLAGAMREVGMYRLTPGRLPAMIEALESVVPGPARGD